MNKLGARREFLTGIAGTGVLLISSSARGAEEKKKETGKEKEEGISPTEDLMREHGVLRRILLVYDEAGRRLPADDAVVRVVGTAAAIVRRFVEGYHEKLGSSSCSPSSRRRGNWST